MIDKIALAPQITLPSSDLPWTFQSVRRDSGWTTHSTGITTPLAEIRITRTAAGSHVRVDSNLPKVYQGHNIRPLTITELRRSCRILQDHVEDALGCSLPPIGNWRVKLAEYCHDWVVDDPDYYRKACVMASEQRRGSKRFLFETVGREGFTFAFGTPNRGGRLYDKQSEFETQLRKVSQVRALTASGSIEELRRLARGRLRFEVDAKAPHFEVWLGAKSPSLKSLLYDLGMDPNGFIAMEWRRLIRTWNPIEYLAAVARIRSSFSPQRAHRLIDAWVHIHHVGWEDYRSCVQVNRSTLKRLRDDLCSVQAFPGSVMVLPALEIHRLFEDW
jgi:hypothetical protein